jgi:hypothetical protein
MSNRTRSKADYTDQHIVSRTRSKMHNINVNYLNLNLFFRLHDVILFQRDGMSQSQEFDKKYRRTSLRLILIVCVKYICQIKLNKAKIYVGNVVR